jgi:hypothetical protein
MNPAQLSAWLAKNKVVALGAAGGGVVLFALHARKSAASSTTRGSLPTYDSVASDLMSSLQPQLDNLANQIGNSTGGAGNPGTGGSWLDPFGPATRLQQFQQAFNPNRPPGTVRDSRGRPLPNPPGAGWSPGMAPAATTGIIDTFLANDGSRYYRVSRLSNGQVARDMPIGTPAQQAATHQGLLQEFGRFNRSSYTRPRRPIPATSNRRPVPPVAPPV